MHKFMRCLGVLTNNVILLTQTKNSGVGTQFSEGSPEIRVWVKMFAFLIWNNWNKNRCIVFECGISEVHLKHLIYITYRQYIICWRHACLKECKQIIVSLPSKQVTEYSELAQKLWTWIHSPMPKKCSPRKNVAYDGS